VGVSWQWAAAAYKQFNTDLGALGVKPTDDPHGSSFQNSDHAGTPENYKQFVVGGARGGGGSNFTGSYSATKFVTPDNPPPPTGNGSLSGFVYFDDNFDGVRDQIDGVTEAGIFGVTLMLSGTDSLGNPVNATTQTVDDGSYSFGNLPDGTYQIFEVQPDNLTDGAESVGTVNGSPRGELLGNDLIGNITIHPGENGIEYNFGENSGDIG